MFSKQLKKYRTLNSYSQRQLAEDLGITQQAVAKWESDKATPDPDMLKKISEIFGISVDALLGGKNHDDNIKKMPKDLNKFLQQSEIIFDGDTYNLTDDERDMVLKSLEVAFYAAKQANKRRKKGNTSNK
jgi:transcriptional regulator with XRE-family HTH domain